jgi:peptidoglycan/xylan/chitin deacetylase (PgdA/CDA1 family)
MTDKVVFVTIDDGIEKDPNFIQMVKDFQIPITISLADTLTRDDYAYFEKLYETGFVSIQNHTVTHPLDMPGLAAARQLDQISGQQEKLHGEYGVTLYIFQPPGGNYDETTITSVSRAGLKGVMLWKEAMQISDMQYQTAGVPAPPRGHHPVSLPRAGAAGRRDHGAHDDPSLPAPRLHSSRHESAFPSCAEPPFGAASAA